MAIPAPVISLEKQCKKCLKESDKLYQCIFLAREHCYEYVPLLSHFHVFMDTVFCEACMTELEATGRVIRLTDPQMAWMKEKNKEGLKLVDDQKNASNKRQRSGH